MGARTEVSALAGVPRADLLLVNDGDLTFAKVRLDDQSWATALTHLGTADDSLARALIWGAAWDMTRDAEVSTGDFVHLVTSSIAAETDIGVVQGVLRQVRLAIDQFAAEKHRGEYLIRLSTCVRELAKAAEPGGDRQLAFARAFAGSAVTNADLELVGDLLDGRVTWDGLVIDTDLRWFLLTQLVIAGARGADDIDAELASDDTATGRRQAAAARAAQPAADAKALAWQDIIDRPELPNAILDATIAGFQQRDQVHLITPYRAMFFDALASVWESRTLEMAQSITMGLYPALLVSQETVDLTTTYLEREMNSALRRLLGEGRDGVERALRARAKDA